jgi:hypothetical protein
MTFLKNDSTPTTPNTKTSQSRVYEKDLGTQFNLKTMVVTHKLQYTVAMNHTVEALETLESLNSLKRLIVTTTENNKQQTCDKAWYWPDPRSGKYKPVTLNLPIDGLECKLMLQHYCA